MYYETIATAQEDDLRGAVGLLLDVLYRSELGEAPPVPKMPDRAPLDLAPS